MNTVTLQLMLGMSYKEIEEVQKEIQFQIKSNNYQDTVVEGLLLNVNISNKKIMYSVHYK